METTLRKNELRASIKTAVEALAVSTYGKRCILEAIASATGLSITCNYAAPGAGEAAGKVTATAAGPAINHGSVELQDELRRSVTEFARRLDAPMERVSTTLLAYTTKVIEHGTTEELTELYELTTRWVAGFERIHGNPKPLGWGWPCPHCSALYSEREQGMQLAPIYGGDAVAIGDWSVYCTSCSFVMSKSLSATRARRHEERLLGGSRLAKKWRAAIKGARYDLMVANKSFCETGGQEHFEEAEAAARRTVWLIQQLHGGGYVEAHGTPEEKARLAAPQESPEHNA